MAGTNYQEYERARTELLNAWANWIRLGGSVSKGLDLLRDSPVSVGVLREAGLL